MKQYIIPIFLMAALTGIGVPAKATPPSPVALPSVSEGSGVPGKTISGGRMTGEEGGMGMEDLFDIEGVPVFALYSGDAFYPRVRPVSAELPMGGGDVAGRAMGAAFFLSPGVRLPAEEEVVIGEDAYLYHPAKATGGGPAKRRLKPMGVESLTLLMVGTGLFLVSRGLRALKRTLGPPRLKQQARR